MAWTIRGVVLGSRGVPDLELLHPHKECIMWYAPFIDIDVLTNVLVSVGNVFGY